MDKKLYLNNLFDYYGELFTDKQKEYFIDYYFNDLSLGEIAENNGISRNAVHGQLKIVEEKLKEYERILKLYEKGLKLKIIIQNIDNINVKKELETLI